MGLEVIENSTSNSPKLGAVIKQMKITVVVMMMSSLQIPLSICLKSNKGFLVFVLFVINKI